MEWLFKTYPQNTDLDQVLIKVAALNTFYSTTIFHPTETAQHICELKDFDERVKAGDLSLVTKLAIFKVKVKSKDKNKDKVKDEEENSKELEKHIFSFASKYCSWHNPDAYPIYDNLVCKKLREIKDCPLGDKLEYTKKSLYQSKGNSPHRYKDFCEAMEEVRKKFNLGPSMKRIDRYLWTWAKSDDDEANKAKTVS